MHLQHRLPSGTVHQARKLQPGSVSLRDVKAQARRSARSGGATPTGGNGKEPDPKALALERAIANLNSKFGSGTVMRMSDKPLQEVQRFSTGCLALDVALGGGWPRGRVVEVYGPESCGKTTLALHACAEVQKQKEVDGQEHHVLFVDVENAMDPQHAARLGVDVNAMLIAQANTGEEALQIVEDICNTGSAELIVVDSVSALIPRAELEGDVGQTQVGGQARLMSSAVRRIALAANKANCTVLFINQLRQKIGVLYGNPETTSGGLALRYYASIRLDLRKKDVIKNGDEAVGIKVKAKAVKNKVSVPFKEATFDIIFSRGIDSMGSLVEAAEGMEIITKRGSWYYYGDRRLGQGREKVVEAIRNDPELTKELLELTQDAMASPSQVAAAAKANGVIPGVNDGLGEDELPPEEEDGEGEPLDGDA